jgi:cobaltochelatase CobS
MTLSKRQQRFVDALASAGCSSPISRQELISVCEDTGIYTCPPSWITQDSDRKAGRGLYDVPELATASPKDETPAPAPVACAPKPATAPQGAVESVAAAGWNPNGKPADAAFTMGMTGGERATLTPDRFEGYVPWGHFSDVEKITRSQRFYPIFITGLSGNGKTLMVEQVCAKLKRECYRVNITKQTDEDDLLGGFRLINGNTVWVDGPVVAAMKNGGVLLLDEIDLGGANLMCLQPVLEGKGVFLKKIGEWVTPADGFTVFATANTKGKGSDDGRFVGTGIMNEAMLDRFPVTFEQPYPTKATERKILTKAGLEDTDFLTHLTEWSDSVRRGFYAGATDEIVSTRRLVDIANAYAIFGDKEKAIKLCLARFDDQTKASFMDLYEKLDADLRAGTDEGDETPSEETADVDESNKCPF